MDDTMIGSYEITAKLVKRLAVLEEVTDPLAVNLADMVLNLVKELRERDGSEEGWGLVLDDDSAKEKYVWYMNKEARDRGYKAYTEQYPDLSVKKIKRVYG